MRKLGVVLLWTLVSGSLAAQGFDQGMDDARGLVEADDLEAALAALLRLDEEADSTAKRERLARELDDVGVAFHRRSAFAFALRSHEAASGIRRRLHGEHDHPDVARSLNQVASCLFAMGRLPDALPQYEASLAMRKRLHGDRDQPDVAQSLNNVASCLFAMGRVGDALPVIEASLTMSRRLYGDRDHPHLANCLDNMATCLRSLGRFSEALRQYEASLAMRRRLFGEGDHPDVAASLGGVGMCLEDQGRVAEALPQLEASLAMRKRLFGDRDHAALASSLGNLAACLHSLGRAEEALPMFEASVAMKKRLVGDHRHVDVARGMVNLASCLHTLGRTEEALMQLEASHATSKSLFADRDHPLVATTLNNLACCLIALGRSDEALRQAEAALTMSKRVFADRDHPDVLRNLATMASCLRSLGRIGDALPLCEASLAMAQRLFQDRDHPATASGLADVASCLRSLGRTTEASVHFEAALEMNKRLFEGRDHQVVATMLNNLASCFDSLGRPDEALAGFETSLAMSKRLVVDQDHPAVATSIANVASALRSLGRSREALPLFEASLAMSKRLSDGRDHSHIVSGLNNLGGCLVSLGRADEALPRFEAALAMNTRLHGDRDHPAVVLSLNSLSHCLEITGRTTEALQSCRIAAAMIERLRGDCRTSPLLRQSMFDDLKRGGVFERLQVLAARAGQMTESLHAVERARGRDLLDMLELRFDPLDEAERRARQGGDQVTVNRLVALRGELREAALDNDRLLHRLGELDSGRLSADEVASRRRELLTRSRASLERLRQLQDDRARSVRDMSPAGRVSTVPEIQSALGHGELFLEFAVGETDAFLFVLGKEGEVERLTLPNAVVITRRLLPDVIRRSSREQLHDGRGRDPAEGLVQASGGHASPELFECLIPKPLWGRLRAAKRVFIAPHRLLHRLSFDTLVVDIQGGRPVYWLDSGPAVSYVPSGSVLHWLRNRAATGPGAASEIDVLAIGDPARLAVEAVVPEEGAFVTEVRPESQAFRIGLQVGDVLIAYDGNSLVDDASLGEQRAAAEAAIAKGSREATVIPLRVWRRGETLQFDVQAGPLGVLVGKGRARLAQEASLGSDAKMERIMRHGDLERMRGLPALRGARDEAVAITELFGRSERKSICLLGQEATESALFDLASKAKYLHLACHGIAEEYAGSSLSMLVLSPPQRIRAEDDGLLKLQDLVERWYGRLPSVRLVVLSACRTNVGTTYRDEAPQALPLGFVLAGAPAVISSLWTVDDESTRILMTDFYQRLLTGEMDELAAFTAAKKALRNDPRYADPFHWGPFLFMGLPN